MTPKQITLLRRSIAPLKRHPARTGDLFYRHLFAFDASLRSLFPADLQGQGEKLIKTLDDLISALDRNDAAALRAFARRHALYFQPPCHNVLREALLWTFAQLLGHDFHDNVAAAWCTAYNLVVQATREAQSPPLTP